MATTIRSMPTNRATKQQPRLHSPLTRSESCSVHVLFPDCFPYDRWRTWPTSRHSTNVNSHRTVLVTFRLLRPLPVNVTNSAGKPFC